MNSSLSQRIPVAVASLFSLVAAPFANADWQLIDNFESGTPSANWTIPATISADASAGFLVVKPTPALNGSASMTIPLPQTYTTGMFTIAFDFYIPVTTREHANGFGVGGAPQPTTGWNSIGARNRFQLSGNPPQILVNAGQWTDDLLDPQTTFGVVYNIWLVYNLDAPNKGVTFYFKKGSEPMSAVQSTFVAFETTNINTENWSQLSWFGIGQGTYQNDPDGEGPLTIQDTAGAFYDSIYFSDGENLTLTPESYAPQWELVEPFTGAPQGTWTIDAGVDVSLAGNYGTFAAPNADTAAALHLPMSTTSGSMTLKFDLRIPTPPDPNGFYTSIFGVTSDATLAEPLNRFGDSYFISVDVGSGPVLSQAFSTADLLNPTQYDKWYHVWLVYDKEAKRVDFYSTPIPEQGDPVIPSAPAGSFNWTVDEPALNRFFLGTDFLGNGLIQVDNIYQSFGTNITLPDPLPLEPGWNDTPFGLFYQFDEPYQNWLYSLKMGFVYRQPGTLWFFHAVKGGWGSLLLGLPDYFYIGEQSWIHLLPIEDGGLFYLWENDAWVLEDFFVPDQP